MKHRKGNPKLGMKTSHRMSVIRNMTTCLFVSKHITTTLPMAKALRTFAERIITRAKNGVDSLHTMRDIIGVLHSDIAVKTLFSDIVTAVANRNGGYLRITKLGFRRSDAAPIAKVEFVDQI